MIIGENPRTEDMPVNPAKAKQLDNMRSSVPIRAFNFPHQSSFHLSARLNILALTN